MKKIFFIIGLFSAGILSYLLFAQDVELKLSHKYHAEQVGASCSDCHKTEESALAKDNLLPSMETCYTCHDKEEECTVCHKDPDNAIDYPRITSYIAKFPHNKHVGVAGGCERCHVGVTISGNIFEKHLPDMTSCLGCHKVTEQTNYCFTCHNQGENLKPGDHLLVWKSTHGIAAQTNQAECQGCHTENYCVDCHLKDNLDHKVHPLNFVNNHALQARGNKENCYTCHEELAFCVDCHQQRMVMPRNHSTANWANAKTGGGHARAAKLDLDSCLSCHSDAQGDPVCVLCHQK
jgi:hypothetical protein